MTPLLETVDVRRQFGGLVALQGINLAVPPGAIVSVIGPNGAGKTTLFNLITGFYGLSDGDIRFEGEPIAGLTPDEIAARGITRTYQNVRLFNNMTALENVLVGQHLRLRARLFGAVFRPPAVRVEEAAARARGLGLLRLLGLAGRAEELAKNLAYGDQRRLEIARALAIEPKLLLLDEPTAGMNPGEALAMTGVIRRLRDEQGITILLIEHNMRVVMDISDRIFVIDHGELIAEGPPAEIQTNPRVIAAYLGVPAA